MPLLPFNRLRKGVVFFTLFIFFFILYRLLFFETKRGYPVQKEDTVHVYTDMCLLITSGKPVNIDTVFNLKGGVSKIFAYSYLAEDFNMPDTVWHIWYYGSEAVKNIACTIEGAGCFSSISADSLQEGSWSIDTRLGNTLLNVRQFRIGKF